MECEKHGIELAYTDTDSLILKHGKNQNIPLDLCPSTFGAFKHEIEGTIEQYISLGPKNYTIRSTQNGKSDVLIKLRGFFLCNQASKDYGSKEITEETYKQFLQALLKEDKKMCQLIPQFQIKFNKSNTSLYSKFNLKRFCNNTYDKRILIKDEHNYLIHSLPIGFTEKMYLECVERNKNIKIE